MRASHTRILAVLVLLLLAAAEAAYASPVKVELGLLAVKPRGADYEGIVVDAVVELAPGSGRLRIEPAELVDESTRYSTLLGFMLAAALAGKSHSLYDLSVYFDTDTRVGGPSASGFLAATVLLLSMGYAPDYREATMTGMVSPSGLVLSVAGVEAKILAAAEHGYRAVLVPALEAVHLANSSVNGVRVVPVCSIVDAAGYLSNTSLLPAYAAPMNVPVPRVFARDAERFINYTLVLAPLLDDTTRGRVVKLTDEARQMLHRDAYSAASLAFTALLQAANRTIARHGFAVLEEKLNLTLKEALRQAAHTISSSSYEAGGGLCYAWRFAALSAASYRLYLAERVSDQATPYLRALALLRALSARTWAEASRELRGPLVPCEYLEGATRATLDYAETAASYFVSILDTPLVRVFTHLVDNRTIREWLADARRAYQDGDYTLAMGLTVYVLSEIEFRMDAPNINTSCITRYVERLAGTAGTAFAVPALYYHRYAGVFRVNTTGSPAEALNIIRLEAAALAWLLPGVFLHAATIADGGGGAAAENTALPTGLPYAMMAVEAILLAAIGLAAGRAAWRRDEVKYGGLP